MGGEGEDKSFADILMEEVAQQATKKVGVWLIGGGVGVIGPVLAVLIAAVAGLALLAGVGQWATSGDLGANPPPIATPLSRPFEWLGTVTAAGVQDGVPNVIGMAVIEQASDGQVYGDRYYCSNGQSAGEPCALAYPAGLTRLGTHPAAQTLGISVGLMGLDTARTAGLSASGATTPSATTNVQWGMRRLAAALHAHSQQAGQGLEAFHVGTQTPPDWTSPASYAATIESVIRQYESGPQIGAWALAPWSSHTGAFQDPGQTPEWVFVVAAAPDGAPGTLTLSPGTVTTTPGQRVCHAALVTGAPRVVTLIGPGGQRVARTVTAPATPPICTTTPRHTTTTGGKTLPVTALGLPVQVWGTTKAHRHIPFQLSSTNAAIPVWPGGLVWGARVPLTGADRLTLLSAQWPNGDRVSIPWPEQPGGATGPGQVISGQAALDAWWPAIQVAAQQTGVPASWIAAEMLNESGGDAQAGSLAGAYGLMQLEPGTDGATNADRQNPQGNLLFGARYLAGLHQDTGSWRLASAAYYGGLGNLERAGWRPGIRWTAAQSLLARVVPDPQAGNTLSLAGYAAHIAATATWVATHAPGATSTGG